MAGLSEQSAKLCETISGIVPWWCNNNEEYNAVRSLLDKEEKN